MHVLVARHNGEDAATLTRRASEGNCRLTSLGDSLSLARRATVLGQLSRETDQPGGMPVEWLFPCGAAVRKLPSGPLGLRDLVDVHRLLAEGGLPAPAHAVAAGYALRGDILDVDQRHKRRDQVVAECE